MITPWLLIRGVVLRLALFLTGMLIVWCRHKVPRRSVHSVNLGMSLRMETVQL